MNDVNVLFIGKLNACYILSIKLSSSLIRWYYNNGRKWKGTKDPLDEGEREEWEKAGLKLNIQKTKIMVPSPITSWQILFSWTPKSLWMVTTAMKLRHLLLGRKAMTNLDSVLKIRGITLQPKICIVKARVFPVVMYGCASWTIKKAWGQRIDAFKLWCWRRLLKSPLDSKEIKPVHPKGNQPWIFTGRTDAKAEAPILCPPDAKSQLTGKDPDAGKNWGHEEKGETEGEMVGWHHWLNGHEFEQTPGDGEGQGSLVCCSP